MKPSPTERHPGRRRRTPPVDRRLRAGLRGPVAVGPRPNHLQVGRAHGLVKVGRETFAVEPTRSQDGCEHRGPNRGSLPMEDLNTNGDEPRLVLTGSGARVVLAETDAPGSLHYLLEAEGFQVVGCAADDVELGRVLGQGLRPDVVVLDADIVATSTLVARQLAPDAHLIAIWPEAVQPPPGGERVDPRMVYEELGPAIRRHMDRATVPVPVIAMPVEEPGLVGAAVAEGSAVPPAVSVASGSVFARAASRMSVLSVTLITAIVFTMGVSFALGGFRWHPTDGPPRIVAPRSSVGDASNTSDPLNGRVPPSLAGSRGSGKTSDHPGGGGDHHATGGLGGVVVTTTGSGNGDVGGTTPPTEGGGSGDQGGGAPRPCAGPGGPRAAVRATRAAAPASLAMARVTRAAVRATRAGSRVTTVAATRVAITAVARAVATRVVATRVVVTRVVATRAAMATATDNTAAA